MEINQVDSVTISSAETLRAEEPVAQQAEQAAPAPTESRGTGDAFQVELSAEARREQAATEVQAEQTAEAAQDESARQAANPNLTYNAAGEVAG